MRKTFLAALVLAAMPFTTTLAHGRVQDRADQQQARSEHRERKATVNGWIRKDGDNYFLEDDKDHQRYRIQNSEAIREHEGHHVRINARVHDDDRSVEVNSVKRLSERGRNDHGNQPPDHQ